MKLKILGLFLLAIAGLYWVWTGYFNQIPKAPLLTEITNVWIRPSVGPNTAGFATINPDSDKTLFAVEVLGEPISKNIELHTHIQEGDVMKMQKVEHFDLKKGVPFSLKCGGDHIMFMEIKKELKEGDQPLKLRFKFKNSHHQEQHIDVDAPIQKPKK
jgi:copper(I)-binding protein